MHAALKARLFPASVEAPSVEAPVERPLVTYTEVDPYAGMTEAEIRFHTHGGVRR